MNNDSNDRAAFEAAYRKELPYATESYFRRDEKGNYLIVQINHAWIFWQAATAAERELEERVAEQAQEIERLRADAANLRALLIRYRHETPLCNQPYMIAGLADAAIDAAMKYETSESEGRNDYL